MPHLPFRKSHGSNELPRRDPENTQAYLVGGGVGSLAAAVHLIQDANVPAKNIHILEALPVMGGSMDGAGDPREGYLLRGGRMLNFSYHCTYDLLERIPSLMSNDKTVMQDIKDFNAKKENQTHSKARLIASAEKAAEVVDTSKMGLTNIERVDLIKLTLESEKSLGKKRIDECFPEAFFKTKFWYMWATMFAFQPWHSAVEFRRYVHRFLHEFPRINTLSGVDRTPYNQYDSIIRPIIKYLQDQGVDFRYNTKVTDFDFIEGIPATVDELHMVSDGTPMTAQLDPQDIVIVTLGSMTSDSSVGTNDTPPPSIVDEEHQDGCWDLWGKLVSKGGEAFGKPSTFCTRINESKWESFTITLSDPEFLRRIEGFSHNEPGTGALMTFKDSNWLMSIVVPHQPHFVDQPIGIDVVWGYGLFPDKEGNFVKKPMAECSGQEILTELLGHFHFPAEQIREHAICRPCMMPYITSQFLTREPGDRPQVIPEGSTNIALLGQFVEIPEDTVFTVEYSVRGAQMAVYELMGLDKHPKGVYKGEHHIGVMVEAMMKMMT
ncbi:67 kDa myosin-cross-reactive antigen family protein [Lindgomyces ingoldianus]|uniref:67 kDa myosin-cross-reactive antigen family protein n=1 Tax=Lindgomyces ingoldianus TaxID=673940 RepID=A0ACB6QDN3_9PLEO|nr:67 kDa myosin-cross-reactive antigen family protein [Lindgomyces ingoldianus]KAF2465094.1 67 kDa myosin-cross-reactive antigen family protein [Lindgomyces ingoldianus]